MTNPFVSVIYMEEWHMLTFYAQCIFIVSALLLESDPLHAALCV